MTNTHEIRSATNEKAVLVSLVLKSEQISQEAVQYSLEELQSLAETAGVEAVASIVQSRDTVDKAWFVGKGKVDEIRSVAEMHDADVVIFNQELSGAQVRNLEAAIDRKMIDRTQLILDIFAQRAKTREGKIQVELAQLQYLLPRLAGHYQNLSRLGGGIGTRGPGETKLETDRRHIQRRIRDLRIQLGEITRHRQLHRSRRRRSGIFQVALVGYTNAGKSTLLNRLTAAEVFAENKLFATLDPTSRRLELPNGREIVLTDTVGFIQQLPHDLVAAFRATLEEVNEADLILHVVDSSSAMRDQQIAVVEDVLEQLGAHQKEQIIVFNKTDLLPPPERELLFADRPSIKISALNDEDLERLTDFLQQKMEHETRLYRLPVSRGDLIARLYEMGKCKLLATEEEISETMLFELRAHSHVLRQFEHELEAYRVFEEDQ